MHLNVFQVTSGNSVDVSTTLYSIQDVVVVKMLKLFYTSVL